MFFLGEGSGPQKKSDDVVVDDDDEEKRVILLKEENSSSCIELDLGVGAYTASQPEEATISPLVKARYHKWCLFTEAQRRELDHQVLIFNHFACNFPLHHHLVPHSAFAAATLDPAFYKQFPTYMSGFY